MELPHPLPTHGHPADPDPTKGVRAAFAALLPTSFSPGVGTESIDIGGIRTLVVRPPDGVDVKRGVVIYVIHPGGFILGAPEPEAPLLSTLAEAGYGCISPDYRLAPEHPYPAAHNDIYNVWEWLISPEGGQSVLGLDISKIIVLGTSAGSALATYLTFRLADEDASILPRLIILDSPHVDSHIRPFPSMSPNWKPAMEGYMWWAAVGCTNSNRYLFGEGSSAAKDEGGPEGVFVNEYPLSKFQELASKLPPFYLLVC
ncbi:alpha/beta-hydrolase [Calocera viscosa TUFC12733]|uniref:Alpha/beta-hydrolase n=1 Tax=Calocera viscosa (strain TUFC12733) TaxID=1330018 RepID=A0A167RTR7_CALVF|nr:alpha/beta-hydrolase [Calocera viscosa TUFC12733]